MSNIFGPQNSHALTIKPAISPKLRYGDTLTFFRDCTAPGKNDGTVADAEFFNILVGNLQAVVDAANLTPQIRSDTNILVNSIRELARVILLNTGINEYQLPGSLKAGTTVATPTQGTSKLVVNAEYVTTAITSAINLLVSTAPTALDTLAEIDAALNNDPNFATTMATALSTKAAKGANTDITSLAGLTTALSAVQGGTGFASYTAGDILYASSTTALSRLQPGAAGSALVSNGPGVAPSFGPATAVLRGYLAGLTLANNTTNPNTQLDVQPGVATSDDNSVSMVLASTVTKTLAAWAVGTGTGGLDTGSTAANTWYHVYLIQRIDTGVVDVLFSLSATAPTLPVNYTKKRRIGSILTTGTATNITAFTQFGDEIIWSVPPQNVSGATLAAGASATHAVTAPPGVRTRARLSLSNSAATAGGVITFNTLDAAVPASTYSGYQVRTPVANILNGGNADILTDLSMSIRATCFNQASSGYNIATVGYIDTRGK